MITSFFVYLFKKYLQNSNPVGRTENITRCGCGVMALAITPPGVFEDLPVFG